MLLRLLEGSDYIFILQSRSSACSLYGFIRSKYIIRAIASLGIVLKLLMDSTDIAKFSGGNCLPLGPYL